MQIWSTGYLITIAVLVLFYAIFSIYLKKAAGLLIAGAFHIILGLMTLDSIGIYILILAGIEIVIGIIFIKNKKEAA